MRVVRSKSNDPRYRVESWPIMFPHSIISYLYNSTDFNIPEAEVKHFWKTSRENSEPWALNSSATDVCVPLGLYGDSATVRLKVGSESVVALFMSFPLWRPASGRASRVLLFTIPEHLLFGVLTLNRVLRHIVWSCNAAYEGYHPTSLAFGQGLPDHLQQLAGTRICPGGQTFTVSEVRGDWAWHKKLFQMVQSWNGKETCHQCCAKSVDEWSARYYNFEGADWEHSHYNPAEFIARCLPERNICHSLACMVPDSLYAICAFS